MAIELLGRWTCGPFLFPTLSFLSSPSDSLSRRVGSALSSHVLDQLIWVCCGRISILMKLPGQCRINFRLQALISIPILRNNTQGNNQDNKVSQRMECVDIRILWMPCLCEREKECINSRPCACVRLRARTREKYVFNLNI